jgi:two-component system OmpR family sensor kinase/two-component system sensor histidine kinase BaeS
VRRLVVLAGVVLLLAVGGLISLLTAVTGLATDRFGAGAAAAGALSMLAVAVGVVLAVRTMWTAGGPLGSLIGAAERVGDGDFSVRVREGGPPFLRSVTRAFNLMTRRLHEQDDARRQLVADVAHELRTPLTIMQGRVEGMVDGVYTPDAARLRELLDDTRVLARLVEDLRTLANADSGALVLEREPTDLVRLAEDVAAAFRGEAATAGVTIAVHGAADIAPVEVDPVRIREVLVNLVANALQHTPAGGDVSIDVSRGDDGRVAIRVRDTGRGIPAADLPRIFDRFYKSPGSRGSGLGLAIARKLVAAHGGELTAASAPGAGTTMTMALPVRRRE